MRFVGAASRGEGRRPCGCGDRISRAASRGDVPRPCLCGARNSAGRAEFLFCVGPKKRNQKKGPNTIWTSRNAGPRGRSTAFALAGKEFGCCEPTKTRQVSRGLFGRRDGGVCALLDGSNTLFASPTELFEPRGECDVKPCPLNGQERTSQRIANRIGAFLLLPFLWPDKEKEVAAPGRNPGTAPTRFTHITTRQRHHPRGARTP